MSFTGTFQRMHIVGKYQGSRSIEFIHVEYFRKKLVYCNIIIKCCDGSLGRVTVSSVIPVPVHLMENRSKFITSIS
jgi:hypothetical protein